jgi:hypothetical protein
MFCSLYSALADPVTNGAKSSAEVGLLNPLRLNPRFKFGFVDVKPPANPVRRNTLRVNETPGGLAGSPKSSAESFKIQVPGHWLPDFRFLDGLLKLFRTQSHEIR